MKFQHPFRIAAGLLVLGLKLSAATITITFDPGDPIGGLSASTVLSNQYAVATGATFSPNGFSGPGGPTANWATNTDVTIVSSAGGDVGGLGSPSLVSGNLLHSFNGWVGEDGDASFRVTFATPVSDFSADFAGISTPGSTRIFAYSGITLLGSVAASLAGNTGQQTLSISDPGGITSVVVTPGDFDDWVGVDNIQFTTSDIPEPATIGLLGGGLAALALARRRKTTPSA